MAAERVIAAVQHRVPVVGVGHPGLEVVGDHLLRAAADIGEGADMGTEPVLVTLASASEKNCRWRSGASTHISTSLTAFSADGLSRGFLTRAGTIATL